MSSLFGHMVTVGLISPALACLAKECLALHGFTTGQHATGDMIHAQIGQSTMRQIFNCERSSSTRAYLV